MTLPIDPCGMIVDYLRTGRRQWARLYRDRPDVLTRIRWYRAAPDAKQLPIPYTFGFNVYDDPVRFESPAVGFTDALGSFEKGFNHGQPGTHYHGQADWFLHGAPFGAVNPDGPCIQWQGEFRGNLLMLASFEFLDFTGSIPLSGTSADVSDPHSASLLLSGKLSEGVEAFTASLRLSGFYTEEEVYSGSRVHAGTQSGTGASSGVFAFSVEDWDTDNYADLGTSPTVFTVPADGIYLFGAAVKFNVTHFFNSTIQLDVEALVNGSHVNVGTSGKVSVTDFQSFAQVSFAHEFQLSAGDTLEVFFQFGGTSADGTSWVASMWVDFRGPLS